MIGRKSARLASILITDIVMLPIFDIGFIYVLLTREAPTSHSQSRKVLLYVIFLFLLWVNYGVLVFARGAWKLNVCEQGVIVPRRFWGTDLWPWSDVQSVDVDGEALKLKLTRTKVGFARYHFGNMSEVIDLIRNKVPEERVHIPEGWEIHPV